jgi:hypothetical protein
MHPPTTVDSGHVWGQTPDMSVRDSDGGADARDADPEAAAREVPAAAVRVGPHSDCPNA